VKEELRPLVTDSLASPVVDTAVLLLMTRAEIQAVYDAGPEAVIALVEMLLATVARQQALIEQQQAAITALTARVQHLENQLATRSHNSSKPPSSDGLGKKTKSRREKSGKKPGGQPGHPGRTLEMVATPDHTVGHFPAVCPGCGEALADMAATDIERRQVFDLPPVAVAVTEHQVGTRTCPRCGCATRGEFPAWVTQPVQYGMGLLSLLVYLVVFQMVPWQRTRELIADLYGLQIGGGTLATAVERCFAGLAETAARIREALQQAKVVGFDETGVRINGKLHWWHTASTPELTQYHVHASRGREGMDAGEILPHFGGRAIHDGWGSYAAYGCEHGLCNAHHLRELAYLVEREGQEWAQELIDVLVLAQRRVEEARAAGAQTLDAATREAIESEYRRLVKAGWDANPAAAEPASPPTGPKRGRSAQSKARNLLSRLERYERETLAFVYDFAVPFENNQAERDLRMMKVQQKISGGFRSAEGAACFGRIRGYLSTMRKQAQPMLAAIENVFRGHPVVPSLSA
jgi:transposase